MQLYNTLTRKKETFTPLRPGKVHMYVCGITAYDYCHIGHARSAIVFDLLVRHMRAQGLEVTFVRNFTDVDDKIIRRANEEGRDWKEVAETYIKAFHEDMDALGVLRADIEPRATEHMQDIMNMCEELIRQDKAYATPSGDVYFRVRAYPPYGKLSGRSLDDLQAGARVAPGEEKEDPLDFALWKAWDELDGDVAWDSPWGKGRPGWHIECSAMSSEYLGDAFDIHTGGIDNMFPHHEDEIAQSEAATGKKWVNYWLHCAHLMVNGEKMSKSLGNFYTLRDLLKMGWKGREIRWVLIGAHYRKKLNFTLDAIGQARETLTRFDEFFDRMRAVAKEGECSEAEQAVASAAAAFSAAIAEDLNISEALAAMFELLRTGNKLADSGELTKSGAERILAAFRKFDTVIGALEVDAVRTAEFPPEVVALAEERKAARKAKNFAESDRLRAEIGKLGFLVEDQPGNEYRLKKA